MLDSLKKVIVLVPFLRTPALLARRIWKDRASLAAVVHDYFETRRETSFLRNYEFSCPGRTVLILAVDDGLIYTIKLGALLASGLRFIGWRPIVVFGSRSAFLGRLYFEAFGIQDFVYLDDVEIEGVEREQCRRSTEAFMEGPLDIQTVKTWCFRGSWIGPQIISTLSRIRFEGMVDFDNAEVRKLLASVLPGMLEHVLRAHKLVAKHHADLAITNEANYSIFGPLVDACIANGMSVIQFVQPWKDDALIFKRLTIATRREQPVSVDRTTLSRIVGRSWTAGHEERLQQVFSDRYSGRWFLQSRNQMNTHRRDRTELIGKLSLEPTRKIAVVFSHVLWDANLFYGADLFRDYGEWFVETVLAACANSNLNWLIKIHPANVWKRSYEEVTSEYAEVALIRERIGTLPAHVTLLPADTDISTYSLFENIDCGVTVRGTAGMELPCFGKPCLTAGTGRYSGLGFTVDSRTREEYLWRLANLHELPTMTEEEILRAKWHAYAAFMLRPWLMKSARSQFAYKKQGSHPLDHNLHIVAGSTDEIQKNGDLDAWAVWASGSDVDFVVCEGE